MEFCDSSSEDEKTVRQLPVVGADGATRSLATRDGWQLDCGPTRFLLPRLIALIPFPKCSAAQGLLPPTCSVDLWPGLAVIKVGLGMAWRAATGDEMNDSSVQAGCPNTPAQPAILPEVTDGFILGF